MRRMRMGIVAAVAALLVTTPAAAQVAWDSPILVPPRPAGGFGLYLIDPHAADLGLLATWRGSGSSTQFRVGLAEERFDDGLAVLAGVDFSGALTRATDEFPLDVTWVIGAGAGIDNDVRVSFPLGLVAGRTFPADDVSFTPYGSPRIVVDGVFDGPGDGLSLDLAVDLGIDLQVSSGWLIRFGGTIGDREALAIGVVF